MPLRRSAGLALIGVFLVAHGLAHAVAADPIQAKIAAAGDAAKHNADAVVVLDETTVTVRPSGIGTAREHVVTKVLRDAAIRSLAVQVFPFDPHTNRLELVTVRVYRGNGGVEEVPLDTKVEQPQAAGSIFWGTQQYLVQVPRLTVGDAVETITEMTGFNVAYLADSEDAAPDQSPERKRAGSEEPNPVRQPVASAPGSDSTERNALGEVLKPPVLGHWHDEAHFWANSYPILEKRYTVRVPRDKPLQCEVYSGELRPTVLLDGEQLVYTFEKKDLVPLTHEPSMEPWPNVGTKLLLATLPTWEDKSRWLCKVSEPQFQADDAIRAKVAEVIKGCTTDEEQYTALNHWVAENVRYAGTSRGMCEGYTIHDVKETFHDRCGVCKDKAGMLVGMLRVAGFESYLVMTMARQRVDRIPADQFNHAVTCIRQPDGNLILLDPTWMPKSRDNWSTLEPLQYVVYGLPEGKGLSQSPDFPPEDNQATWQATSTIDAENGLSGSLEFTANGAPEGRLRRALAALPPDERDGLFDETFQRLSPNARATLVACTDPVDFSGPIAIQAKYEVDGFALGDGPQRYLALPMLKTVFGDRMLNDLFGNTSAKERKYGLQLRATRLARFEETIALPAGWEVTRKPDPVDLDYPVAGLHFKIDSSPGQLHYTCELVVKRWIVPSDEYGHYRSVIDKFEELAGPVVTCEVEVAHAQ